MLLLVGRMSLVLFSSVILAVGIALPAISQVSTQGGSSALIRQTASGVEIRTDACILTIRPMAESAMRVRCAKEAAVESPSIVLLQPASTPAFKVSLNAATVVLATSRMKAVFDRKNGALHFTDGSGHTFLSEIPSTRRLDQTAVQGEATFEAEQAFLSPPGEHLFGSGEFQDGFLDIRDLPRRLTQVNSQIAIPFLLSSKGYGILWHNYGLTNLNPADNSVKLTREASGNTTTAAVTTAEGARTVSRTAGVFRGDFETAAPGRYAMMLDVGQEMAQR